jgi:4-amino-4-deoxy-L-arabinose transferase-like glycosyltransferase
VLGEVGASRFPSALLHGACVGLVYWITLALWGFAEAIVAALCLLLLPRALFHAGLAAFDAPIMTLWFATVVAYWRCLDGRTWPWQVGVCWGLALATKHTALLLPFALGVHYAVLAVRAKKLVHGRVLVSLAVLGPLVLYALWPLLWTAPFAHVKAWLAFHTHHVHYNFEYLGDNWNHPRFPWHFALVTTLFTVPTATLAAALTGAIVWIRKRPDDTRRPVLLLALSAAASIGPFFLGSTPIFGAEKHWMPVLPTLCIAAEDDPFLPPDVLPRVRAAASPNVEIITTPHGGHVGFVAAGTGWNFSYWAEELVVGWLVEVAAGRMLAGVAS